MSISLIDFYILYRKIPHIILKYIFNPRRVISIYSMHMILEFKGFLSLDTSDVDKKRKTILIEFLKSLWILRE